MRAHVDTFPSKALLGHAATYVGNEPNKNLLQEPSLYPKQTTHYIFLICSANFLLKRMMKKRGKIWEMVEVIITCIGVRRVMGYEFDLLGSTKAQ